MEAKLTLKLDKNVIENARKYAKDKNTSLSSMVEKYFSILVQKRESPRETHYSPLVKELSGIIKLEDDFDFRESYTDYLMEKYQ